MNPYRDDPLYRELIPQRITPASPNACANGPSALFVEIEREKWEMFSLFGDDNASPTSEREAS